jgi:hypothetical protein
MITDPRSRYWEWLNVVMARWAPILPASRVHGVSTAGEMRAGAQGRV